MSIVPIVHLCEQTWQSVKNTHNSHQAAAIHIRGDPYRHPYCVKISAKTNHYYPKLSTILYTAASFKTISFQDHCVANCTKIKSYDNFFQDHCILVYFQHNGRTAHIPTTHIPLALRGPADSIPGVAESCHPCIGSIQYSPR